MHKRKKEIKQNGEHSPRCERLPATGERSSAKKTVGAYKLGTLFKSVRPMKMDSWLQWDRLGLGKRVREEHWVVGCIYRRWAWSQMER